MHRLRRQAGKWVRVRWGRGGPAAGAGDMGLVVRISPAGLLESAADEVRADLVLAIDEPSPLTLAGKLARGDKPAVREHWSAYTTNRCAMSCAQSSTCSLAELRGKTSTCPERRTRTVEPLSMPRFLNSSRAKIRCFVLLAKRSNLQTSTTSNRRFLASLMS